MLKACTACFPHTQMDAPESQVLRVPFTSEVTEPELTKLEADLNRHNIILVPTETTCSTPVLIIKKCINQGHMKLIEEESQTLGMRQMLLVFHNIIKAQPEDGQLVYLNYCRSRRVLSSKSGKYIRNFIQNTQHTVAVHYDTKIPVLECAVHFLEAQLNIELRLVKNESDSPLLVLCTNDTHIEDDLKHLKYKSRREKDVMLLVVTDKQGLHLEDACGTKGYGATDKLIWDHDRDKFGQEENLNCLVWVANFLKLYLHGLDVTVQISRTKSLRRSMKSFRLKKVSGKYCVIPPMKEKLERNIVVRFDANLISLTKVADPIDTTYDHLIKLCDTVKHTETAIQKLIKEHEDNQNTLLVFLYQEDQSIRKYDAANCKITRIILTSESSPKNEAKNRRAVEDVRRFLTLKELTIP